MAEHENKATETQRATSAPENLLDDFGAARSRPTESVPVTPPPQKAEPAEKPAPKESAPAKAPAKKPASQSKAPAKKPTAKKSAGSSPSSGSKQAKVKNQNAKEDKDPNRVQASTATAKKAKSGKPDYTDPAELRSSKIGHRVVPYILVLLAIFIGISLLLNLFCNLDNQLKENPSEHLMGVFGYYVCYGLLGVFGPAVFVLPLLLVNLAIFWKKYVDNSMVISKILVSAVFLLIFSAVIHSFCLSAYMSETGLSLADCNWTAGELMDIGADPSGGGVLGGKLGYMMVKYLNVIGSLLVGFLLLFASLLYILGVTPRQIWRFFRKNSAANAARRAEKRELQRSTSRSELEAEDAHLQAQMDEKIRRITAKDGTTDTAKLCVSESSRLSIIIAVPSSVLFSNISTSVSSYPVQLTTISTAFISVILTTSATAEKSSAPSSSATERFVRTLTDIRSPETTSNIFPTEFIASSFTSFTGMSSITSVVIGSVRPLMIIHKNTAMISDIIFIPTFRVKRSFISSLRSFDSFRHVLTYGSVW